MTSIQSLLKSATELLNQTSDSARLDAEVLLCHVLDKERAYLRAWPEMSLPDTQTVQYNSLLEKRSDGYPIAYLTGTREFWSRPFITTPDVLIPRPETENLVELCLDRLPKDSDHRVIDLGTGSGAIAVTLAAERPTLAVTATDISAAALKIARKNARLHGVKNISFCQSDWFENVRATQFDLIISNPPYIAADDPHLTLGDLRFEPDSALVSGDFGLQDIASIVVNARHYLKPDGLLLLEHGSDQQDDVQGIMNRNRFTRIETHNDLSGLPRVTSAQGPQTHASTR